MFIGHAAVAETMWVHAALAPRAGLVEAAVEVAAVVVVAVGVVVAVEVVETETDAAQAATEVSKPVILGGR